MRSACEQPLHPRHGAKAVDTAVISPFSPIARAAKAPACSLTWKARAVPMPRSAMPMAKPCTAWSLVQAAHHAEHRADDAGADHQHRGQGAVPPSALGHAHRDRRGRSWGRATSAIRGCRRAGRRCPTPIAPRSASRRRARSSTGRPSPRFPRPLRIKGNCQRDGGRPEQEVHELRAVEIGLVGRRWRGAAGWRGSPGR